MTSVGELLAEIQGRADAATEPSDEGGWMVLRGPIQWEVYTGKQSMDLSSDVALAIYNEADARFIAAARTDVPRLVAALQAVRALCDRAAAKGDESGPPLTQTAIRSAIAAALEPAPEEVQG